MKVNESPTVYKVNGFHSLDSYYMNSFVTNRSYHIYLIKGHFYTITLKVTKPSLKRRLIEQKKGMQITFIQILPQILFSFSLLPHSYVICFFKIRKNFALVYLLCLYIITLGKNHITNEIQRLYNIHKDLMSTSLFFYIYQLRFS